jgi:hypothetical protein
LKQRKRFQINHFEMCRLIPEQQVSYSLVVNNQYKFLCCDCGTQQLVGLTCVLLRNGCNGKFFSQLEWSDPSMEFAHKPKTQTITSAMLALMETEVSGPRLPAGPMPFMTSYLPVTNQRKALHRVKYYSVEELQCSSRQSSSSPTWRHIANDHYW